MAKIDYGAIGIADTLLKRNMLKNGTLEQKIAEDESNISGMSNGDLENCKDYISKPYIAELRIRQAPIEEFNDKTAKLKILGINEEDLKKSNVRLDGMSRYLMQDLNGEDIIIEIEEEPAFKAEDWKLYRKNKDTFKEELNTCMYEITTKESLARAGIILNDIEEEGEKTLKTCRSELLDIPDKSQHNLPEEIPIKYVVTISSKTPIEVTSKHFVKFTMFTYINMSDTYINNKTAWWFISGNSMLKMVDISGIKVTPLSRASYMFEDNKRLHTIIGLSNLKFNKGAHKVDIFAGTQIKDKL